MTSLNRLMLMGTLGQRPELKRTQNGKAFCRMSVATHSWDKENPDSEGKTLWHTVHVFGRQAETAAEYLSKGRQVFVEGRVETSHYESAGQKVWRTWITADKVTFLGGGQKKETSDEFARESVGGDSINEELLPDDSEADILH